MNIVQIYRLFPTETDCISHIEAVRWKGTPVCPYCQSTHATPMPKESRYHCNTCNTTFSVTVSTIFHHTHAPLQKWFLALSLILNAKKGISARNLARELEVHRNTAWFMAMRIRRAMTENPEERELLKGIVEMDEAYFGGKPRKGGPKSKRRRGTSKTAVIGIVQRNGNVVAKPVKNIKAKTLSQFVREHVDLEQSIAMTDSFSGYLRLATFIRHYSVNHKVEYVSGNIHTNSIESNWALLKRGMIGQYHRVSGRYLPRYVDEFSWRWNNRKNANIFERTLRNALGVLA